MCRYTLLLGKPPFETSCLKDTYTKIKKNEYYIPAGRTSASAKHLIEQLLQSEPTQRPTMEKVLQHEFFTSGRYADLSCIGKLKLFYTYVKTVYWDEIVNLLRLVSNGIG